MNPITFINGSADSGKSTLAAKMVIASGKRVIYTTVGDYFIEVRSHRPVEPFIVVLDEVVLPRDLKSLKNIIDVDTIKYRPVYTQNPEKIERPELIILTQDPVDIESIGAKIVIKVINL